MEGRRSDLLEKFEQLGTSLAVRKKKSSVYSREDKVGFRLILTQKT
jgi:hypothetical protein